MDADCKEIKVTGRVQGVGFRYSALITARKFELTGYVRNMPDESVYIIAQGKADAVQSFIEWCKEGPSRAAVESVEFAAHQAVDLKSFQIR